MESNGEYWEATYILKGTGGTSVFMPWSYFGHPAWYSGGNNTIDLGAIAQISLFVNQDGTSAGSGALYFDAIQAANAALPPAVNRDLLTHQTYFPAVRR